MQQQVALNINSDDDDTPDFECDISGIGAMDVDINVQRSDDVVMSDLKSTNDVGPQFSADDEQPNDDEEYFNSELDEYLKGNDEAEADPQFIEELEQVKANIANLSSGQATEDFAHF